MRADEEVRQNSSPLPTLSPIIAPRAAGAKMRIAAESLNADFVGVQKGIAIPLFLKMNAELCIHNVADCQRATA